ncbi:MAG TPA: hypothetical protein VEQ58_06730 [Polyangiaceae bacterium]|nr:hypothetical protein [Polyangiaceae bacterium]
MGRFALGFVLVVVSCRAQDGLVSFDGPPTLASAEAGAKAETPAPAQSSATGEGGARDDGSSEPDVASEGCAAEPVTLEEIHAGRVRSGRTLSLTGLVASSQKFLVSEARSGSCLWGAFAAGVGKSGAGSGLFLVSFGAPHADGEACAAGADGLPDDLRAGDALDVEGTLDSYVPAACDGVAPAPQLRIDAACPVRRGAPTLAPEPSVIDSALAARLAAGKDAQLLRDWSGALVALEAVSAVEDPDDGDAVFPFGVIQLAQTPLEVHSKLYYFDLSEGGPRAAVKTLRLDYPWSFQRIVGLVFLDYCSWSLAPRDRCRDLSPASKDCAPRAD